MSPPPRIVRMLNDVVTAVTARFSIQHRSIRKQAEIMPADG